MPRPGPQYRRTASLALSLLAGFLFAALALPASAADKGRCHPSKWLDSRACDSHVISKLPYTDLKQRLLAYVEKKKQDGTLADTGVYFRDLEDGPHFGVNEYASFAGASLFKLPVVIQYLYLAEQDPQVLQERLRVPEGSDFYNAIHPPPQRLVIGQAYAVEDLLFRTMAYSDNVAFVMLRQHLIDRNNGDDFLVQESFRQIGLVPQAANGNAVITVMRYSSVFKVIYGAAFLNPEMSDKLVGMMLATTYEKALVRGVPADVKVAHKFGITTLEGGLQLHDCGILYYPGNPYMLCVMTRGKTEDELAGVIADISRMVYEEVDSRRSRTP